MKKIFVVSLGLVILSATFMPIHQILAKVNANAARGAAYAYSDAGELVASQGVDRKLPIASLTKLMTAIVLEKRIKNWDLSLQITKEVIGYPKKMVGDAITSEVALATGDVVPMSDLRIAMLAASSNQSTVALARATGLSDPEFVAQMNEEAMLLGLKDTEFFDPTGLDVRNVSTPREMALIAEAAFAIPIIARDSTMARHVIVAKNKKGRKKNIVVLNRNQALLRYDLDGFKIGYLIEAQYNVVVKKDDRIVVVLHATTVAKRNRIVHDLLF